MIIDILINVWIGMLNLIILILPEFHLPDFMVSAFNYFMFFISGITLAFPFLFAVWVVLIVMILFKLTVRFANFAFGVAGLIRGSGKPEI